MHFDLENMKARLDDVDSNSRLYLERDRAVLDKQLSDFHSATANLELKIQDMETKNAKVTSPIDKAHMKAQTRGPMQLF